ncbi:hypothetical protein VAR608DRAFT_1694 [Variovorax sp. HW608]|uniref:hypothetical protein n=1 Tax=Variovorax sp. HW608 TaxID=1034889 RepID=UPI00082003C4|nr:hypothetical protein [Variovorax sp. HW608]SCK21929.1 hypothetical protein VAR608DRAFT_1694 [Variovorax sp. HW608]
MVTLRLDPSDATLAKVCARFGLSKGDIDENFGVASLDPAKALYAILVNEAVAARLEGQGGIAGVFSNPKIEPFGPLK